jgi:DNA polymerase IIIc chi subunit
MSKELVKILTHILDRVNPEWKMNPEIVSTLINLNNKSKTFVPPTLSEVTEELRSQKVRHYQQQAEKFWNFYEAKNWMIGKNKMKNWKSAIKTWGFEKDNLIL